MSFGCVNFVVVSLKYGTVSSGSVSIALALSRVNSEEVESGLGVGEVLSDVLLVVGSSLSFVCVCDDSVRPSSLISR